MTLRSVFGTDSIFARWFPHRSSVRETKQFSVPDGSRIYAIGDVHGCVGLLRKLHAMILEDSASHMSGRKVVVYLGDYIDRGLDARAVIDLLIDEPLPGFKTVFLKGNHEESLLQFLEDPQIAAGWQAYGGDTTLYSYGVRPPDCTRADEVLTAQRAFAKALPPAHLKFFQGAKLMHVEGDYAFVHAGFRENIAIEEQATEDMLWIRDEFLRSQADFGKIVVHGHSINETPVVRCNRIGIDTGAFATGKLTSLALEGTGRWFLST
jgi:serine/threonine protein phosphatase 1